jgi:hypothetical protein
VNLNQTLTIGTVERSRAASAIDSRVGSALVIIAADDKGDRASLELLVILGARRLEER